MVSWKVPPRLRISELEDQAQEVINRGFGFIFNEIEHRITQPHECEYLPVVGDTLF
jgi:hypothetical protein